MPVEKAALAVAQTAVDGLDKVDKTVRLTQKYLPKMVLPILEAVVVDVLAMTVSGKMQDAADLV